MGMFTICAIPLYENLWEKRVCLVHSIATTINKVAPCWRIRDQYINTLSYRVKLSFRDDGFFVRFQMFERFTRAFGDTVRRVFGDTGFYASAAEDELREIAQK